MENLTHSLVGLLCAEIAVRVRERKQPLAAWTRGALYATAIIGNNLPDLDFTYSHISGPRFGYLLQHRGYTHTLLAALGFALATLIVLALLAKRQHAVVSPAEWRLLGLLACVSPLLHIAMDYANNYGVHPFWPLYNGWFYGDSIFILEPSLWLLLPSPLLLSYRSKPVRITLALIMALGLGAVWYRPLVPTRNAVLLTLLTLAFFVVARRRTPFGRMLLASAAFALVLGSFVLGSRLAKALVRKQASAAFPNASTVDVVATPMPANPWCWSVLLLQREGAQYSVRIGRAAVWPGWLDVRTCPYDRTAKPGAPLLPLPAGSDARLVFSAEYRVPLAELRALDSSRCEAHALFSFARVPYVGPILADGSRVIGDLRYDRNPGLDFSDVRLPPHQARCPEYVPPWLPPRSDILF